MAGMVETIRDRGVYVWGIRGMRLAGLAALVYAVAVASPRPGGHGTRLAVTCVLVVAAAGWVGWLATEGRLRLTVGALVVMAVGGGALGALSPHSPAIATAALAVLAAGGGLSVRTSLGVAAAAALALTATGLVVGTDAVTVLSFLVVIGAGWGAGLIRLGYAQRADQAVLLLEQTRRAHAAEAEAAALAERTRIAREIHDVLAHSLGALAMQLEAAGALLAAESLPADDPSLTKAAACVERAGQLTREGLAEARRAILALRHEAASLPDLLTALAAGHKDTATLKITGTVRDLPADAGLALYRTAQEALTNATKHAPDTPVALHLAYFPDRVSLTVTNPLPHADTARPLTATGTGYGLTGLRERAELASGTLSAGPDTGQWRVCATIPA